MNADSTRAPVGATTLTTFSIHASAYRIARRAYELHRDECQAPLEDGDPLHMDYDDAYTPLVSAMTDTATSAVLCPAPTIRELATKIAIFHREDMQDMENAKELIAVILADAQRLAGGVA